MTKWIEFWDMHSGGGIKEEPYQFIYIEADDEDKAKEIFMDKFGHNPDDVACECCGGNYAISESDTLEEATEFNRQGLSVKEFENQEDVLIIRK